MTKNPSFAGTRLEYVDDNGGNFLTSLSSKVSFIIPSGHKKKIAEAEEERLDRFEKAKRLIEKKLREEEKERKLKGEETKRLQLEEVRGSGENEKKSLTQVEENRSNELQEQEKIDNQ